VWLSFVVHKNRSQVPPRKAKPCEETVPRAGTRVQHRLTDWECGPQHEDYVKEVCRMSMIWLSLRNLWRSPLRTALMVALLAVSIGLALIMFTVHGATVNQLASIGTQIGTEITIRPAGSYGGMGGGELLAQEDVDKLSNIDHVVSVQGSVDTQYTGSSLQSALGPGTYGNSDRGPTWTVQGGSPPVTVMGFDTGVSIAYVTLLGDAKMDITEGRYFTADDTDTNVMVVGKALADKNNLAVGSTVNINGTSVKVIGIYDSGQVFGNNMLVMPIGTVERLFDIAGLTSVTVVADDVDNVDAVVSSIRDIFPTSVADVTSAKEMYERINAPVTGAESSSTIGMIVAFVVAGVVVLFSVVLMIRQRVKEIGILKAIGASSRRIGLQFSLETLAASIVGAIIGALITYPLAQKVANLLTSSSTSPGVVTQGDAPSGGVAQVVHGGSIAGIHVAVSPTIFLYALAIAAALAIVASVLPAWYIGRVRPAEVLRNE
jgi:putative ABC transport system permease protein